MTQIPSRPFPAEEPKPAIILPVVDPVRHAAREYRRQLADAYQAELAELRSYALSEWSKFVGDHPFADNRSEFINDIVKSLAPEEPPKLSDGEAYRLSLPYESRLHGLGEHKVFDEFAKVSTFRAGGRIALKALRKALLPYAPDMTANELFKILDEAGLTVHNGHVLFITGTVEQERRADFPTLPIGAERQYRDQLITETDRFNSEDY